MNVLYTYNIFIMINIKVTIAIIAGGIGFSACNHPKPKPVSNDVTKTAVAVNGKKDSVINNPQKNYGNATVSEPCVKCLLDVVQNAGSYKKSTNGISPQSIIYDVNWITSKKPLDLGDDIQIINGMRIDVEQKAGDRRKNISTYAYNNAEGRVYLSVGAKKYEIDTSVGDTSVKKIRNACFWGVSSAK